MWAIRTSINNTLLCKNSRIIIFDEEWQYKWLLGSRDNKGNVFAQDWFVEDVTHLDLIEESKKVRRQFGYKKNSKRTTTFMVFMGSKKAYDNAKEFYETHKQYVDGIYNSRSFYNSRSH